MLNIYSQVKDACLCVQVLLMLINVMEEKGEEEDFIVK